MRRTSNVIITVLWMFAIILLGGCGSTANNKVTKENCSKVSLGMTKKEVVAILGEPTGTMALEQKNDKGIKVLLWQGRTRKFSARFDDNGKLERAIDVLQTSSPVSLADARKECPIPLPDSATKIQYAVWGFWIAHEEYVRFQAPTEDCLAHARKVMQTFAEKRGCSVVTRYESSSPSGDPPEKNEMLDV